MVLVCDIISVFLELVCDLCLDTTSNHCTNCDEKTLVGQGFTEDEIPAVQAYCEDQYGDDPFDRDAFLEAFRGKFENKQAFIEEYLLDFDGVDIPKFVKIDYEGTWDYGLQYDFILIEQYDCCYVFRSDVQVYHYGGPAGTMYVIHACL